MDSGFDRATSCDTCLVQRALAHLAKGEIRRGLFVVVPVGLLPSGEPMGRWQSASDRS